MESKPKFILVGMNDVGKTTLHHAVLKEKYGDDIILVTPDEAKERGLTINDLANIPTHKYTAQPAISQLSVFKSGKENRRERRSKDRKKNRK